MIAAPRFRRVWLILGWVLVLMVVTLSLVPLPAPTTLTAQDKLNHLLAYATLMAWWTPLARAACRPALALLLLGLALELLQARSGYREGDIHDMAANALGVGLGALFARLVPDWMRRCERAVLALVPDRFGR